MTNTDSFSWQRIRAVFPISRGNSSNYTQVQFIRIISTIGNETLLQHRVASSLLCIIYLRVYVTIVGEFAMSVNLDTSCYVIELYEWSMSDVVELWMTMTFEE